MKKYFWIFMLSFFYLAACQNQESHTHDDTTHTHENGDHMHDNGDHTHEGEDHDHGDGTHTHADGTTHADHTGQEEFEVDTLSQDTIREE